MKASQRDELCVPELKLCMAHSRRQRESWFCKTMGLLAQGRYIPEAELIHLTK